MNKIYKTNKSGKKQLLKDLLSDSLSIPKEIHFDFFSLWVFEIDIWGYAFELANTVFKRCTISMPKHRETYNKLEDLIEGMFELAEQVNKPYVDNIDGIKHLTTKEIYDLSFYYNNIDVQDGIYLRPIWGSIDRLPIGTLMLAKCWISYKYELFVATIEKIENGLITLLIDRKIDFLKVENLKSHRLTIPKDSLKGSLFFEV